MNKQRLIIKISGESIQDKEFGHSINPIVISDYAKQIIDLAKKGYQIGVVFGGGNIWRGGYAESLGLERVSADYMGMLATVINSLALKGAITKRGGKAVVMNAFSIEHCGEPLDVEKATKYLDEGAIVIFGAGTGLPYVSTDTASALRAIDIKAPLILFGKHGTDGLYDKDPNKFEDAVFIKTITYNEAVERHLTAIDGAAMDLCQQYGVDSVMFNIDNPNSFANVLDKKGKFTTIFSDKNKVAKDKSTKKAK